MHGPHNTRVIVSLSYTNPQIDAARREAISHNLAEIMLFSTFFHEIFMKSVIAKGIAPSFQGAPLSKRERECLVLAAHGQTTQDMAHALGIGERTIQFHFDGIRSKLGAANRQEAVAKAIAMGIIQP
jgi:DNA-binding CsgD family transcriptional regulator